MANDTPSPFKPHNNMTTGGAVGVIVYCALKVMIAYGARIDDEVLHELPFAVAYLAAYLHDCVVAHVNPQTPQNVQSSQSGLPGPGNSI